MSITGQPGGVPTRAGILIGDIAAGMLAVVGLLSAVIARQSSGRGQHVDISMLDTQVSMLNYLATMHLLSGEIPGLIGNTHFEHVPYNTYRCLDGYIIIAVVRDEFWSSLVKVLADPQLDTPENKTRSGRLRNRAAIDRRLDEIILSETQEFWLERLRAARIPCAPVNNLEQALQDEQVLHRSMVVEIEHVLGSSYKTVGNPVKLSESDPDSYSSPPLLGQHTEEVLAEILGKSLAEVESLRALGAI